MKLLFETRKLTCALNSSSHLFMGQQQLERVPYPVGFRLHLIRTVDAKIAVNFSKTLVIQSVQSQHFRN